jgi:hypothetical protein
VVLDTKLGIQFFSFSAIELTTIIAPDDSNSFTELSFNLVHEVDQHPKSVGLLDKWLAG